MTVENAAISIDVREMVGKSEFIGDCKGFGAGNFGTIVVDGSAIIINHL